MNDRYNHRFGENGKNGLKKTFFFNDFLMNESMKMIKDNPVLGFRMKIPG